MDQKTFDIIQRISNEHCHKTFGYLDEEDLKNEIWVICLEKLSDYTPDRGYLEHFLRVSVKNRLINRFKDITKSVRSPCPRCPYFLYKENPDCGLYGDNKLQCNKWKNYQLSVESRNSLLNASEPQIERETGNNILNRVLGSEIKEFIFDNISEEFDHDLNCFLSGRKISKQRIKKLKKEILRLITERELLNQKQTELTIKGNKYGRARKT
jgi:hypothetical protein